MNYAYGKPVDHWGEGHGLRQRASSVGWTMAKPSTFLPFGRAKASLVSSNGEMWTPRAATKRALLRSAVFDPVCSMPRATGFLGKCGLTVDDLPTAMYESNQPTKSYNRFFKIDLS
jgi:hypothetical protein